MPRSNFAKSMIYQMGVPVATLPTQGKVYHILPITTGSDGNDGKTTEYPVKTIQYAHTYCMTADQNDIAYLYAQSNTGASTTDYIAATAPLVWSKDLCHLIGVNNGPLFSQRSRVAWLSTTSASADKVLTTFSGDNCKVENIQFFCGMNDANLSFNVLVSGDRNHFENCHFAGIGHATNDATGAYSLKVTGSENYFKNCVIGLDTIIRTGANYELIVTGGRNVFDDCLIVTYSETSGRCSVQIDNSGGDMRYTLFRNCTFIDYTTNLATGQTNVFDMPSSGATAYVYLDNCRCFGGGAAGIGSAWSDVDTSIFVSSPIPNTAGGKALAAT